MKTPLCTYLCLLFAIIPLPAAVTLTPAGLFVEGVIEGSLTNPDFRGDTIDYLSFEVITTGPVRLIATDITRSIFLATAEILDDGDFANLPPPYRLFTNHSLTNPPEFTKILNPGLYFVQVAEEEYRGGDLSDSFVPVNRSGGGFVASPYSFRLEGQFQPLDFMEGNLNGTFTVTPIVPEPSTAALLGAAAALGFARRRG
jgi:hypothetical protein